MTFTCHHVSLVSSGLRHFFVLCLSWPWHFWRHWSVFLQLARFSICLMLPHEWIQFMHFCQGFTGWFRALQHCIILRVSTKYISSLVIFLTCKVTFSPFVTNKYLSGRHFDTRLLFSFKWLEAGRRWIIDIIIRRLRLGGSRFKASPGKQFERPYLDPSQK
jgi:hypothetical protein